MPRYYGYSDPASYYADQGFDPYTGRLQGGALVMSMLNQLAGQKKQKQDEAWAVEDRQFQQAIRELQKKGATLDVQAKEREAQEYQSPTFKEFMKRWNERRQAQAAHKNRMEEIGAAGTVSKDVATIRQRGTAQKVGQLDTEYKKAKSAIESRLTAAFADIEKAYTQNVAKTRGDIKLQPGVSATPSQYLVALKGHLEARKRMRKEAEKRYQEELKKLEDTYKSARQSAETPASEAESALPAGFTIIQ